MPVKVQFRHSPTFDAAIKGLLSDDELREMQEYLCAHLDTGDVIRGTGGVRKMRWTRAGMGKSGGVRVWYLPLTDKGRIHLIVIYPKSEEDNLSRAERNAIKTFVEQLKREP